jgi:hypothetical protein
MAFAPISDIREGLARNLDVISDVQVSAYMPLAPTMPALWVTPASIDYDRSMMRGLDVLTFTITAAVSLGLDKSSQVRLDGFMSPSGGESVKEALEKDRTLGGTVQDILVDRVAGYRFVVDSNGQQVVTVEWTVLVNS